MRRLFLFALCLLAVGLAKAKLQVSTESDGTVVLTLEATGDLGREFTFNNSNYSLDPSATISPYLTATKIKIVTKNGAKMNESDFKGLCGISDEKDNFKQLATLDMENADVESTNDYGYWGTMMKWIDPLKKYTFPKSATHIPAAIFSSASVQKIEEVIIPDNLERTVDIGQQAFSGCSALRKVYIGGKAGQIGSMCFNNCTALTTVDFGYGSTNLNIGTQAFYGCSSLTKIVLPEGLKEIGPGAFSTSAIRSIRLPNSLEYIRATAFNCEFLESITIPENVKLIERTAFQNNKHLKDVYVLGENTEAQEQAFEPLVTYSYTYSGAGNGEIVNPREKFASRDGRNSITIFHYPEKAKDKYVNPHTRTLGTPGNTAVYAQDSYGNKFPTFDDGKYNANQGDYAGWNNFMISAKTRSDEIWEDTTRVRDKWYSMCVPFDMTEEQLQSAYGATVEVVEFSSVDVEEIAATRDKYITLNFKRPVTSTKAHHPYMIHPGIHSGTLKGVKVTIVGVEKKPETQTNLDGEKTVITSTDGIQYTFIGNYAKNKGLQQYSYFYYSGDDETQWKNGFYKWTSATGGTWTPYTACILLSKDNGAQAKPKMMFYETPDNTVTSIETLPMTTVPQNCKFTGNVMNLNGQVVRTGSMSLTGLSNGIYIVNGKKIVVR